MSPVRWDRAETDFEFGERQEREARHKDYLRSLEKSSQFPMPESLKARAGETRKSKDGTDRCILCGGYWTDDHPSICIDWPEDDR